MQLNQTKYMPMKLTLLILGALSFIVPTIHAQTYSNAVVFSYDNAGNRIKREIKVICIGCPDQSDPPGQKPGNSATSSDPASMLGDQNHSLVLRAYPNPLQKELTVEYAAWQKSDNALVKVFDMTGRLILSKNMSASKTTIDFSGLASEAYYVTCYLNGVIAETWKIIKPE